MATPDVTYVLDEAGVHYELITHAHTETATAEAEALGLAAGDVAKTLVLRTPDGYLRAVLPASERLDLRKLRQLLGAAAPACPRAGAPSSPRASRLGASPAALGRRDPEARRAVVRFI